MVCARMKKRKVIFIFILMTILLIFTKEWSQTITAKFLEVEKCPACYGTNQCFETFKKHSLELISFSKWKIFNVFLNVKNIYYARSEEAEFVLKKLAHDSELIDFDAKLCNSVGHLHPCNVSEAIVTLIHKYKGSINDITENNSKLFEHSEVIKCKQLRTTQFLYDHYRKIDSSGDNLCHFITLLAVNPEPLILQAFKGKLPLPLFIGSCGRIIVEESGGRPLSYFYQEAWIERAKLAIQLLQLVISFSENEIRIYITDPSADNFAVDSEGRLKMIDVENVVLVDSLITGLDPDMHENDDIGCTDCLSYDYEELCSHSHSDHNYFAICKGLLSSKPFSSSLPGGLLHSIPSVVQQKAPTLLDLIENCAQPLIMKRRNAALNLLKLLGQLVKPPLIPTEELEL